MQASKQTEQSKFTPTEVWILAAAILASSMVFIDSTALNVSLPAIQASLSASGVQLLWVVNAYTLMLAALILVGGSLGDNLGRKKIFMIGICVFMAASLFCGLAPTIQWLIFARIIQGIGGALLIPGSLALIAASVDANRMGKAIGAWSAATTLILIAGPVLGGALSDLGLWRWVFFINLPLGIVTLFALQTRVPESRDETAGGIDLPGAALITLGLAGLAYGFTAAPEAGFTSLQVMAALITGVAASTAFIWLQSRKANPMMPLHLFRSRTFAGANLLTLFLYSALNVYNVFLSLNLVQVQGYTKTQAGLAMLPFIIILTLLSGWAGGLVDRHGPRLPLILGPALAGAGFFWTAFAGITRGPVDYWAAFLPGVVLFGIGMGFTVAPLSTSVMGSVGQHFSGVASGINNAVSRIGGVLAVAIAGSVALFIFAASLEAATAPLNLSRPLNAALMAEAAKLGGASVPAGASPEQAQIIQPAIRQSFVDAFRVIMVICAGLAWLSALLAALLVEPRLYRKETG